MCSGDTRGGSNSYRKPQMLKRCCLFISETSKKDQVMCRRKKGPFVTCFVCARDLLQEGLGAIKNNLGKERRESMGV